MDRASVEWRGASPYSPRFADTYFASDDGPGECRHVFLGGNDLPRRFRRAPRFTIGELGFGAGLNLLVAAKAWLGTAPAGSRLDFLSFERYPVGREVVFGLADRFPVVAALAQELAASLPLARPGAHRVGLAGDRIGLTLVLGDARRMLPRTLASVDAWFLDGFAPSRNPELWEPSLLAEVSRRCAAGATFATFTAAGAVRRALDAAGFLVERCPGFGRKREMLRGTIRREGDGGRDPEAPWFDRPPRRRPERVLVVGAGLAGSAAAARFAARGIPVTVVDREPEAARGASGNPAAIVRPAVTRAPEPRSELAFAAFELLLRSLDGGGAAAAGLEACGVLEIAPTAARADRFARGIASAELPRASARLVDPGEALGLGGCEPRGAAVWYARGGFVDPAALCRHWLGDPAIDTVFARDLGNLRREGDRWRAVEASGASVGEGDAVVLATGFARRARSWLPLVPLAPLRGQIARVPATESSTRLRAVLCGRGTITPARHGRHVVGATYDREDDGTDLRAGDHRALVERARRLAAELADLPLAPVGGRASVRAESPDRLPAVGGVPDPARACAAYGDAHHGRHWKHYPACRYLPGLYASLGHGSRGAVHALLAAELLASLACGEPLPLSRDTVHALHPGRFLIRDLRRAPAHRTINASAPGRSGCAPPRPPCAPRHRGT